MNKRLKAGGDPLPLASLRLLASPLQLTYAYIWQVIQQRDVRQYNKVEEFVSAVLDIRQDLLRFKQSAQLLLGLRARIILELLQTEDSPDSETIQALIEKLDVGVTKNDTEVHQCQTNFTEMVQMLLKNPAQRNQFFKDVFPAKYGSSFDTALQTLIAGLVCKLEQLLPVPNLSQLGVMISTAPSDLEACGQYIPDPTDLKTLLQHKKPKMNQSAISSTGGDCVLSALSFCPAAVEPPTSQEVALSVASPAAFSDVGDLGEMSRDSDDPQVTESPDTPTDRGAGCMDATSTDPAAETNQEDTVETNTAAESPVASTSQENTQEVFGTKEYTPIQERVETEELQTTPLLGMPPEPREPEESPITLIPLKIIPNPIRNASASPNAGSTETSSPQKPLTQRVTLQQWVSRIAINSLSLPALPPFIPYQLEDVKAESSENRGENSKVKKTKVLPSKTQTDCKVTCEVCSKKFRNQSLLEDHQRIHTGERPYPCSTCSRTFRTQGMLKNHQMIHTSIRPYNCGHCARGFMMMSTLRRHVKYHVTQKPFYCEICNKGFTQYPYFRQHMECHTSTTSFHCKYCGKAFPTGFKLENHERWHTRERPHMCERCGKRFTLPSMLRRHMGYHIGNRQYLCSKCGKTFVYESDLKKHQRYHVTPRVMTPCDICQKRFSSKESLRIHMRIHTQEKPYQCPTCKKSFSQFGNLQTHLRMHSDERPYSCEVCGRTYKLSSHLNVHKKSHTCERPWTCHLCGKGFPIPGRLKRHMLTHTREEAAGGSSKRQRRSKLGKHTLKTKPCSVPPMVKTPCPMCGKNFTKYTMRIHMRTHTQEKPYQCSVCKKAFTQIGNLQVHKRLHTDARPYSCDVCGRTYKLSSHLNVHKKSHTGERPWKCDLCEKSFSVPGSLKKHMLIHTREQAPVGSGKRQRRSKYKKHTLKTGKFEDDGDVY